VCVSWHIVICPISFFFQPEDGIRDFHVTGVQTCALPISERFSNEISLKRMLRDRYGEIYTVHRLDKGTSGLILYARNLDGHKDLNQMFEDRKVTKKYLAIVEGRMREKQGEINAPILKLPGENRVVIHKQGKDSLTS